MHIKSSKATTIKHVIGYALLAFINVLPLSLNAHEFALIGGVENADIYLGGGDAYAVLVSRRGVATRITGDLPIVGPFGSRVVAVATNNAGMGIINKKPFNTGSHAAFLQDRLRHLE